MPASSTPLKCSLFHEAAQVGDRLLLGIVERALTFIPAPTIEEKVLFKFCDERFLNGDRVSHMNGLPLTSSQSPHRTWSVFFTGGVIFTAEQSTA